MSTGKSIFKRAPQFDIADDRESINTAYNAMLQKTYNINTKTLPPNEPGWFPTKEQVEGPFEITPDLAQVRIVHSVGLVMENGEKGSNNITWANIIASLPNNMKEQLKLLSATQTLPASVKIVAATVGDNPAYRDMCHVKVRDGSGKLAGGIENGKLMNTPHLYKNSAKGENVGYPLHLLTDEGGYVLEEPPQLTDTFKHYWYISNSMLTSYARKLELSYGNYISVPKNSAAARLMYFVLVVKNGAMAGPDDVTGMTQESFEEQYNFRDDESSWRFPEATFNEVTDLLAAKLQDVRDKSFDCTSVNVEVEAFDIFKQYVLTGKGSIPVLITLEIDLHLPMSSTAADETGPNRHAKPVAQGGAKRAGVSQFQGDDEQ